MDVEIAQALVEAARRLHGLESVQATVRQVAAVGRSLLPGGDAAGVSMARPGTVRSVEVTDDWAGVVDAAQFETGDGPRLPDEADARLIHIEDVAHDQRWPHFGARAYRLGLGSLLTCQLPSDRAWMSVLTLYARTPGAFDQRARTLAVLYAGHAAIAVPATARRSCTTSS